MNQIIFPEDVDNAIQRFCMANEADQATTDILLAVGAELLDIDPEEMLGRIK